MSENYWEGRYQSQDMPWEKGEPSQGLVDFLAAHRNIPRGTVCVPGCGTGHDVCAWAREGFEVLGLDLAPSAIHLTTQRIISQKLPASAQLGDFLRDQPRRQFDWLFEHTLFCAIDPNERELYVKAASAWVKPGGNYLAVNYLIPDTNGPPFGTTRSELWDRFSGQFKLIEEWVPRSYPNRTGLERMMWWQRAAF